MLAHLFGASMAHSPHDSGVRQIAALSARLAYLLMCLTLIWGIFTATGWITKMTGRQAVRSTHLVMATFTLSFGVLHAVCFLYLTDPNERFGWLNLSVPLAGGGRVRWALGIVGLELMLAIAISAAFQRLFTYRKWLRLHQTAYVAVGLTIAHSWLGAVANGHLAVDWLAGLTALAVTIVFAVLRFVPARTLAAARLLTGD